MNTSIKSILVSTVLTLTACSMHHPMPPPPPPAHAMTPPPPPPSSEEMQRAFTEYATPGAGHKKLEAMVGNWKYTNKMWMAPGKPPEMTEGTSVNKMILGGRYLEESVKGTAMGKPYEGRGIIGFDNVTQKYTSLWIDNMGTGFMTGVGSFNEASSTLMEQASVSCPVQKAPKHFLTELDLSDKAHPKYEMFADDPSGKAYLMMEITYRR